MKLTDEKIAKLLIDGDRVRRRSWESYVYIDKENSIECLELEDLMANDWEVVGMKLTDEKADELKELCRPVAEWLRKNRTPHDSVVINSYNLSLGTDIFCDYFEGAEE